VVLLCELYESEYRTPAITNALHQSLGEFSSHFQQVLLTAVFVSVCVLGAAISAIGPEAFLGIYPLIASPTLPIRSWILTLLREQSFVSTLEFFNSYIIPESEKVKAQAEQRPEEKGLKIVWTQMWDLWPSFCANPTDIPQVISPFLFCFVFLVGIC
jgi:hypothetical protein